MPRATTGGAAPPLAPAQLPARTALSGPQATRWAAAILLSIGAPTSNQNVNSLLDWFHHEGGGGQNNPMNTTLASTPGALGPINSIGVQNYSTPAAGVAATAQTLLSGYPSIVSALRSGGGLGIGSASVAQELSTWSGGGYSSLSTSPKNPPGGALSTASITGVLSWLQGVGGTLGGLLVQGMAPASPGAAQQVGSALGQGGPAAAKAVPSGIDAVGTALSKVVDFITNGTNWLRIGEVIAGIVLVLLGLKSLTGMSAETVLKSPARATKAAIVE